MKKVLILSCSTGQGHNSCAQAIQETFEKQGIGCDVQDALDFISKRISMLISKWHSRIYRYMPCLFSWGYSYGERHPELFREGSGVYRLLTSGDERMYEYILTGGYDTVICTHVFSALILTHMLKKHPMHLNTAFVATDYTCSPCTEMSDLQYYFIPDPELTSEYAARGIPADRIISSGIPVRSNFGRVIEKNDAKRLLGLSTGRRHLLVMCGSMGCGPIRKMLHRISKTITPDTEVSVICGTNSCLCKKLRRRYRKHSEIHIIGYSNQMSLYMDSADLYLTKPGGISVTEAATKKLPMAFINAVAGCESYNMKFFLERGAAITADSARKLAEESIRTLTTESELICMENAMQKYEQPDGAEIIFSTLNGGKTA